MNFARPESELQRNGKNALEKLEKPWLNTERIANFAHLAKTSYEPLEFGNFGTSESLAIFRFLFSGTSAAHQSSLFFGHWN